MKKFIKMIKNLFPRHQWSYTGKGHEYRTCACCTEVQRRDMDDWGSFWTTQKAGNPKLHQVL